MMKRLSAFWAGNTERISGIFFVLAGIAVAIVAQVTLNLSNEELSSFWNVGEWWDTLGSNGSPLAGLLLYALAGALFILGLRGLGGTPVPLPISIRPPEQRRPRFGLWFTSMGLTGLVAAYTIQPQMENSFALSALWVLSIGLLVASALIDENWQPPSRSQMQKWLSVHRAEILVILTILVAAFFIRFFDVELHPYSFVNDEGRMGNGGRCIIQGDCANLFATDKWAWQPMLAFLPFGISIALFGNTALAVRLVTVIIGTLAVLAVYLFTRDVFDKKTAWLAALLLATLPFHVHFSRLGVNNIVDSLTTPLVLWLLFRGAKRNSMLGFLAAGVVSGLCIYTYPGSRLAPVLGLVALGCIALQTRGFIQAQYRNILIFLLAATIVSAPMIGYYYARPGLLFSRLSREGILQNGSLQTEMSDTGQSAAEILTRQFLKSSLVYIATIGPSNFFNTPKPYLSPLSAVFFMLGLMLMLWRIKDARYLALFIWFWAAIILGSTLTGGPPTSQRMLMSTSPMVIIIAISVMQAIKAVEHIHPAMVRIGAFLPLLFLFYTGYTDINFYFNEYRVGHYFEDPTNELTYESRLDITPLRQQGRYYLIANSNDPYLTFPNFEYFSPIVEKHDFDTVTRETLAALPRDKDALFMALPARKSDLELIAEWIPGGAWKEVPRRYQPAQMLYYAYKISAAQWKTFKP